MTHRPDLSPSARLSPLFERFRLSAHLFHAGTLCGVTPHARADGLAYLHWLRAGEMTVQHPRAAGGPPRRLVLREPTLLLYPRPLSHTFHTPAAGADLVCASLHFQGGATHPLAQALPALIALPLADLPALHPTLDLLFAEAGAAHAREPLLANRLVEVFFIQLLRWLLDQPGRYPMPVGLLAGLADERLARALQALHTTPAQPWSLDTMARLAGMSRSAFAQHFKACIGQTPAAYLAQWRLTLAAGQLQRGRAIAQVAHDVGYGSASALSRAFGAHHGHSPRAWLQQTRRTPPG